MLDGRRADQSMLADCIEKARVCFLQVLTEGLAGQLVLGALYKAAQIALPSIDQELPTMETTLATEARNVLEAHNRTIWTSVQCQAVPDCVVYPHSMILCGMTYADLLWQRLDLPNEAAAWCCLLFCHLHCLSSHILIVVPLRFVSISALSLRSAQS